MAVTRVKIDLTPLISLAARRANQIRFGEEARHRIRIAEEEAWLRKL